MHRRTGATVALIVGLLTIVAVAVPAVASDITDQANWRVFNVMPATSKFWDINKPDTTTSGGKEFPIQQFDTAATGSFVVYFLNNYNVSLTDDSVVTADVSWTSGVYVTRGYPDRTAYVRLEFQDVTSGKYTSNDYWWYSGYLDLNAVTGGTLTAALSDRAHWTNVCGQLATDTTAHPGPNCVGGTDPAVSPYDGFTHAMAKVKMIGLSFGRASRYASGVAMVHRSGTFTMTDFRVTP
jgi:hypothetical protein